MEARVAAAEAAAEATKKDVSMLRARMKALRARVKDAQQASNVKQKWSKGKQITSDESSKGKKGKGKGKSGAQVDSDAPPPPPKMFCTECNAGFPSKTKLFLHLKSGDSPRCTEAARVSPDARFAFLLKERL